MHHVKHNAQSWCHGNGGSGVHKRNLSPQHELRKINVEHFAGFLYENIVIVSVAHALKKSNNKVFYYVSLCLITKLLMGGETKRNKMYAED